MTTKPPAKSVEPAPQSTSHFTLALAGLLRHRHPSEIADDLRRYKEKGYTGIWIENDVVAQGQVYKGEFGNNWRLYDIFDFTLGSSREAYRSYLSSLCDLCAQNGLDVYASFWMPKLNPEFLSYLRTECPEAVGVSDGHLEQGIPCLCTCEGGKGLDILERMVRQFMEAFPQIRGIKVATEDNSALNCSEDCPHAHGTRRARHAANMFAAVQRAMLSVRSDAQLLLYPWFWRAGYAEEILPALKDGYLVVTKMEKGSVQMLEGEERLEPLFDSSIVSDCPGDEFVQWTKKVGADRIVDMVPVGTGIDDFFLAAPPYPGRLYRRFRHLADHGVRKFLDFECGAHHAGSCEEAVGLFNRHPDLSESEFIHKLAAGIYQSPDAQSSAVAGWKAFDQGFGHLPIGLRVEGQSIPSGRIGFAWSMCVATPLLQHMFGGERGHGIHWFSPYNFFHSAQSPRLEVHFSKVLASWQQAEKLLGDAAEKDDGAVPAMREWVAAQAHVISMRSVLNWCAGAWAAAHASNLSVFAGIMRTEIEITEEFVSLRDAHPWIWANNCWDPHLTPLSQRHLGVGFADHEDVFEAKRIVMEASLNEGSASE